MPSKLQKAIGAVKDQTSLSLAKVSKSHSIDVAVLRATSHDDVPVDDRHVAEVLALVSSDPTRVRLCAHAIARRIGRTRNWVVALKSLVLVERILQNDDVASFPREVQDANVLNLKNFRDDSNSSPRDFFVGAFAHYLHDRVESVLTGRLGDDHPVLLEKIAARQRLLDRVIGVKPAGPSKNNRLVQNSLYGVVRESFDLHRDVSDGLDLLLDTFFDLPYDSCADAFQAFLKASKQFGELSEFYEFCKKTGVGTTSEYPNVQNMSEELLETLREFLTDQSNFTCPSPSPAPEPSIPAPADSISDFDARYRSSGDDDGSGSSVPAGRASISNSVLDLASFDDDRAVSESRRQEGRDQSGHGYKQSWEIVLFDESKPIDPEQCVEFDILSQATPSQRWTNPFLNELVSSLPSTPEDQSGFQFPAISSSPATRDRNDPFDAPSTYDEPALTIPEEAAQGDVNVASNDFLQSFLEMSLQNDAEEIPLQSDAFAHVTPPQRHSIAQMPLQNDAFVPTTRRERHSVAEMPLTNDAYVIERRDAAHLPVQNVLFPRETLPQSDITARLSRQNEAFMPSTPPECHITTRMPLQNDLFATATPSQLHNDPFMLTEPSTLQNALFSPVTPARSHDTTQMSLQNDSFVPATPSQLQNDSFSPATPSKLHNDPPQNRNTTQMSPPNDLSVSSTQSKHHNDPFVPETPSKLQNARFQTATPPLDHITTQMSLHNDIFGPDVPFMPATPPQRHVTTQMSLHNDPFGPATPTQSQNVLFPLTTPPQSHVTTQMSLQNDSFAPATQPQRHNELKMQSENESDTFTSAIAPQRHNASIGDANQPTFQASPTFFANESNSNSTLPDRDDPFAANATSEDRDMSHEKQLWLEYQNKIIAKHKT